jgi:hypothetical protein
MRAAQRRIMGPRCKQREDGSTHTIVTLQQGEPDDSQNGVMQLKRTLRIAAAAAAAAAAATVD